MGQIIRSLLTHSVHVNLQLHLLIVYQNRLTESFALLEYQVKTRALGSRLTKGRLVRTTVGRDGTRCNQVTPVQSLIDLTHKHAHSS